MLLGWRKKVSYAPPPNYHATCHCLEEHIFVSEIEVLHPDKGSTPSMSSCIFSTKI